MGLVSNPVKISSKGTGADTKILFSWSYNACSCFVNTTSSCSWANFNCEGKNWWSTSWSSEANTVAILIGSRDCCHSTCSWLIWTKIPIKWSAICISKWKCLQNKKSTIGKKLKLHSTYFWIHLNRRGSAIRKFSFSRNNLYFPSYLVQQIIFDCHKLRACRTLRPLSISIAVDS